MAGGEFNERVGHVAVGLEKCTRADAIGIGPGAIEQVGIAESQRRLRRRESRLRGDEHGKACNFRQTCPQSLKAALVIATVRMWLGDVELEHQASVVLISEKFDLADSCRNRAWTELVDGGDGAIDQRRADRALLDCQQLVRGETKVCQRKLWLA